HDRQGEPAGAVDDLVLPRAGVDQRPLLGGGPRRGVLHHRAAAAGGPRRVEDVARVDVGDRPVGAVLGEGPVLVGVVDVAVLVGLGAVAAAGHLGVGAAVDVGQHELAAGEVRRGGLDEVPALVRGGGERRLGDLLVGGGL